MKFPRASGILLHPTSLPGEFGIGDFGPNAFEFVDQLARAGQTYWQILPLGPTGYGDSPYQCFSAFAGNTLLISPEKLIEDGLISKDDLSHKPNFLAEKVEFGKVRTWKTELLGKAYESLRRTNSGLRGEFETFCRRHQDWLDDYALYRALKNSQSQRPWYEWPDKLKLHDERTIHIATGQLSADMDAEKFSQFLFFRQWLDLKLHANARGIKIIGDIPIFVALDSSDVWRDQNNFKLNPNGTPKVVAGVPRITSLKLVSDGATRYMTGTRWSRTAFDGGCLGFAPRSRL